MKFVPKELEKTADISRGTATALEHVKTVASVVLTLVASWFLLGLLATGLAQVIPDSLEARMFSWADGTLEGEVNEELGEEFQRAQAILADLLEAPGLRDLPYRLFLLDLPMPNAVAVPGGGIGVSPALLEEVQGDRGLAVVLAHELGHHENRHGLERLGRGLLVNLVAGVVFGRDGPDLIGRSLQMAELGFSRSQELEADEYGLRLVASIHGDTEGALEFFELIQKDYESALPRWSALFATHPYTPDRIERLRELSRELASQSTRE